MKIRSRVLPIVVALSLFAGCTSINPVTGQREFVLMSPEREAALGKQAAQQVAETMGLVDDPRLNSYVSAIGDRLARVSPRQDVPYTFHVVDMAEANAFALPGGYVYVSRGLLALCNSEAELVNVVGHEIGHVAARHSAQRETRAAGVQLLSVLGTVLAGAYGGESAAQTVGQMGQLAGAGLIASYGRDQEREADRVGQGLSARTGWDPRGMTRFLSTLRADSTLEHGDRMPTFLDSHPSTQERVSNTATFAASLSVATPSPIAASRENFLSRISGIRIGADPAGGVVRDGVILHPDLDFRMRFPDGWQVQNSDAAVGALKADKSAQLVLEGQGRGTDPRAAAQQFLSQQQMEVTKSGTLRIANTNAFRAVATASTQGGAVGAELTWLAHEGSIYRVTGVSATDTFASNQPAFREAVASFRRLTSAERSSIQEHVLGVASARSGETISRFNQRTRNTWSVEKTAVSNGISPQSPLRSGQRLKISLARRYRSDR